MGKLNKFPQHMNTLKVEFNNAGICGTLLKIDLHLGAPSPVLNK